MAITPDVVSPPGDEERLVERLRARDERAFETLVRTHGGRLLNVARRFLKDESDAQDALQEAFVSAFRSIDRFQGQARLSTWLHRIVVNAALMKLRKQRRLREEPLDDLLPRYSDDGHPVDPAVAWRQMPDDPVEREQTRRLVRDSIDRLPNAHRTVLLLRDIEELSTSEAADLLGITPNAVKVRLHRARQALRELLDRQLRGREGE
jgi:RNA polymerase sigma-70 factor (ECF subfamily)